ncbi:MAG: methyl-accepting chemotaxis protein [Burkholderiales bacterium]
MSDALNLTEPPSTASPDAGHYIAAAFAALCHRQALPPRPHAADPAMEAVLCAVEHGLGAFARSLTGVTRDIARISECNFSQPTTGDADDCFPDLRDRVAVTQSNVTEALRQMSTYGDEIKRGVTGLTDQNLALAERTEQQAVAVEQTGLRVTELTDALLRSADNAKRASSLAEDTGQLARGGGESMDRLVEAIAAIEQSSRRIESIVGLINEIAFQTNILSLNAAVEAARAGEQGRSFAVVASEVRSLATRCAAAAQDIKSIIGESIGHIRHGQQLATETDNKIERIVTGALESASVISEISRATVQQTHAVRLVQSEVAKLETFTRENNELAGSLSSNADTLRKLADYMGDAVGLFVLPDRRKDSHPIHGEMRQIAAGAAKAIGNVLESAVRARQISLDALFDEDYEPVPDTKPQKFVTQFDRLTDRIFPAVQEPLLDVHPGIVYAGAVDRNGYFPTHNRKFSHAMTGNYEVDLKQSRTKRIFDDRVGITCGRHEEPARLQTYRRDTGELMFDMSVPIYVAGRHWGGFRLGYRVG